MEEESPNPFTVGDMVRVTQESKLGNIFLNGAEMVITSINGPYIRFFDQEHGYTHWCFELADKKIDYSAITKAIIGG
jgi:hypothetical protein